MKKILVNVCISITTFLLCFLLFEAGIRIFGLAPDIFLQQDKILGVWHIPNQKGVYFRRDVPKTPIVINSQGLRDNEYSYSKPENTYRIAILGDSFSEAIQVPLEHTYHQLIETKLNAASVSTQLEVINFGVGGYGTTHEYLMFQHHVLQYQPDMVVLQFMFGNDIYENSPALNGRRYLPYFVIGEENSFTLIPPDPIPFYMRLGTTFKLIPFLYYRIVDGSSMLETFLRGIKRGSKNSLGFPHEYIMYAHDWDNTWQNAWEITQRVLSLLNEKVISHQLAFMVVGIPDQLQVDEEIRKEAFDTYPEMRQHTWAWEKPNQLLQQFCEAKGIRFFDLSPTFKHKLQQDPTSLYYRYDGHWNIDGHRLAAQSIFDVLRQEVLESKPE